jgi:hypothetical protein
MAIGGGCQPLATLFEQLVELEVHLVGQVLLTGEARVWSNAWLVVFLCL